MPEIDDTGTDPRGLYERVLFGMSHALVAAILILALGISYAWPHDRWSDGSPVPDWVKGYCCGPADVHHYRYDEIKITPAGYVLPDYPDAIPASRALPSEDGDYWAFFVTYADGSKSAIYCFFSPPSGF